MPDPIKTSQGKVVLWERASGQRLERWPVDARGMVAQGDYTFEPPAGAEAVEGGDPVPQDPPATAPLTVLSPEHPLGGPLKVVQSGDAPAATPVALPKGRRTKGA